MKHVWIATEANDDCWQQIVTDDSADVVRFLIQNPEAHVSEWDLSGNSSEWEMVGP